MKHTKIKEALGSSVGTRLTIKGWLRTRRSSKADGGLSFLSVSDGTCFDPIQVVATSSLANYASEIERLTTGCAVVVHGSLVASPGKGQQVEIKATEVDVIGWVDEPDNYPVPAKRHTFEYLREVAHLRVRTNAFGAMARVRHCLAMAIHRFFDQRDFFYVHTPIITANDCEGAGEMFRVSTLDLLNLPKTDQNQVDFDKDFFGRQAHLTVSGQLSAESYCCALSRVYTFGPTFRAENSNTSRHLSEFWMIEPELAFADLADNADLAEEFLKYLADDLLTRRADDMNFFNKFVDKDKAAIKRLQHIIDKPFLRMTYTEAVAELKKAKRSFDYPVEWGIDLQSEHERYLTEERYKQPIILLDYPKDIKAFYMRMNGDGKTVAAMDVLVPQIGEIIGGSQREERLDRLDRRIGEMGLAKEDYWWYRDLRRYGTVPHSGFGLGFERILQFCTGMKNIRDVIPFPRAPRQAEF
jgi:asparaginyl-tRNA synthetase